MEWAVDLSYRGPSLPSRAKSTFQLPYPTGPSPTPPGQLTLNWLFRSSSLTFMATYEELIMQDVHYHQDDEDASSWPFTVSQLILSLKDALKLPRMLKSGPVSYTNRRAIDLIDQLRVSEDALDDELWDSTDKVVDKEMEERMHVVFNTVLDDCARIQAVVRTENLTYTQYPKESFLVILIRNAILDAHKRLSWLEDAPVAFPRHFSGEPVPNPNYMKKNFYVPLIISVCQEMPVPPRERSPDVEQHSRHEESTPVPSERFSRSPPTVSEWLDAHTGTPEEVEEEQPEEETLLSSRFDAYFISYPPSTAPPTVCHIPLLCMAEEEQLPVLMSSLLYQRRLWRISDPLIGIEFSKYDTTIGLFVGWLEDDSSSARVLPRVHLLEVDTPFALDLASTSVALVLSRMFLSLQAYISRLRDSARDSMDTVLSETETPSPLSWRIDTGVRVDMSDTQGNNIREKVLKWAENQSASEQGE